MITTGRCVWREPFCSNSQFCWFCNRPAVASRLFSLASDETFTYPHPFLLRLLARERAGGREWTRPEFILHYRGSDQHLYEFNGNGYASLSFENLQFVLDALVLEIYFCSSVFLLFIFVLLVICIKQITRMCLVLIINKCK